MALQAHGTNARELQLLGAAGLPESLVLVAQAGMAITGRALD
jgi:hypothetical protein